MRLIDATIQPTFLTDYILERKSTFIRVLEKGDNDFLFGLLMDYFDEQPAAYDVDKVVEQLEEWTFNADVNIGDGTMMNHNLIASKNAIDIAKAGGKNDNNL